MLFRPTADSLQRVKKAILYLEEKRKMMHDALSA